MKQNLMSQKNPVIKIVAETISEYEMFQPGDQVLVGVSGGPDSVALFHILQCLSEELKIQMAVGHLNHGLRGEAAEKDARFAQSTAEACKVPFFLDKRDVRKYQKQHKLSLEEAARNVRYDFLLGVAKRNGYNKLALGHHADDNAEQILMHLFRGTGPLGMSGIPPVRGGKIVRPLIELKRTEILQFLKENRIDYVLDESNKDPKYLRNRIRNDLVPIIKASLQPQMTSTLTRLSQITAAEEDWLKKIIEPVFNETICQRSINRLTLSIDQLKSMHPALQRRILRKAVLEVKGNLRRITYGHIEAVRKHLNSRISYRSTDLPDRIRVLKNGRKLTISKEIKPLRETGVTPGKLSFNYCIQKPETVLVKEIHARMHFSRIPVPTRIDALKTGHRIALFDMDIIRFPLILRNFHPGDRFSPLGMAGTQKVKDFFINNKISRGDRKSYPMLLSDNRIIWVVGLRINDSAKVTPSTQAVLKAEMVLLDDI